MIKVNYDYTTGAIKGFYPDDIAYANIPEPHIEIDEGAHQDCMNHQGLRKVDLVTQKIVEYVPEIAEPTREKKIAALDAVYQPQFTALAQGAGLATLDGNEATLANIKEDYVVLKTEYKEKLEAINNG